MLERIWSIWLSGGWVMIPLFVLAVLLYSQALQLVLYLRRSEISGRDEVHWFNWIREPEKAPGRVGDIIRFTQTDVSSSREIYNRFDEVRAGFTALIQRRTRFLGVLVAAAPLLGLLGTVLGMLQTFLRHLDVSGGTETAGVVASGISEALVTTQTGLTIALPGPVPGDAHPASSDRAVRGTDLARLESMTLTSPCDSTDPSPRSARSRSASEATPLAKRSIIQEEDQTEINLSSMIDCIFILLIFFIVTTVFVEEKGLQVNKPDAAATASTPRGERERGARDHRGEQGRLRQDARSGSPRSMRPREAAALSDPETPVVDPRAREGRHGTFVAVWDAKPGAQAVLQATHSDRSARSPN